MKRLYLLLIALFTCAISISQTIVIGGQCIQTPITLTYVADVDGKPAYLGTGTVLGFPNVELTVYWIPAPENLWVIAFDGQPFFQNPCNTPIPPGTSPAICPWVSVPESACTGASPLSVSGAVILPVNFTSFTALAAGDKVHLQWTTAQESNNRGFTVQRSADGGHWTDLGFVAGASNTTNSSSYRYTDQMPLQGTNLYRLRQEDLDGRNSFSQTATATINSNRFFTLSNNPGNGIYKLNMAVAGGELQFSVTDANGKMILNKTTTVGAQVIDISNQAPGIYWLMIKKGTTQTGVKLIKL